MKRMRLLGDLAALSLGEGVSKIAGFAAFAWLARVLTPEGYGAVELAASLALFFSLVVDFGLGPIGAREIAQDPGRAQGLVGRLPALRLMLAALAIPLMAGTALLLDQPPRTIQLIWIFSLSLVFIPGLQRFLLQGLDRMSWLSLGQALRMLVFAAGVFLLVRSEEQLLFVGLIEIAAMASMALYFLGAQLRLGFPLTLRISGLRSLLREAWPVGAEQVVWSFNQFAPTLLVAWMLGGDEIAWFGSSHRIVISLGTFVWLYHFNLYPTLARRAGTGADAVQALMTPSARVCAWLGIVGALVLSLLAEPLMSLAFGPAFAVAAPTFAVLAWVLPVSLLSGHARFALIASGNQKLELGAQLLGALVTVAVGLLAVPRLGGVGAALTMIASTLCVWVAAHLASARSVARLPFLGPVWRPALAAGAAALLVTRLLPAAPWAAAAAAGGLCLALAPLVDPQLRRDLPLLAGAKSPAPPGTQVQRPAAR